MIRYKVHFTESKITEIEEHGEASADGEDYAEFYRENESKTGWIIVNAKNGNEARKEAIRRFL